MATPSAASKSVARGWQARGAAGWLSLAASPTFALMAWMAANHAPPIAMLPEHAADRRHDRYVRADEPLPPVALAEARFQPHGVRN
jgi:hypothetical protein